MRWQEKSGSPRPSTVIRTMMKVRVLALVLSSAASLCACQACQTAAPPNATATGEPVPSPQPRPAVAPVPVPSGDVEFRPALDLGQTPKSGELALRGGSEAVSSEWPASLYATFAARGATASCTAALIGPTVMLTAAHCVPAVGDVTFTYQGHPRPYAAACTRHPAYGRSAKDPSADFALCIVRPAFAAPAGFRYETVSSSGMAGLINATVVLTGFGCVSSVAASAPFDGKYRIGFNTIDESSASMARTRGDEFYAPKEDNNLFTRDDPAKANLCGGDSGGPVFARTDGPGLTARAIVGITSRVFQDAGRTGYGSSIISATGSPAFRDWAGRWARQAGASACGIAGQLPNCRS